MRDVKTIKADLETAEDAVRALKQELHDARVAEAGIAIGDIVRFRHRNEVKEGRITRIEPVTWGGKPWLRVVLRKKNGEWGIQERHVFSDWERVDG